MQNASYSWPREEPFTVANCAVYRQVLDLADLRRSLWVIPGGANGDLDAPHATDQLRIYQQHGHLAMHRPTTDAASHILELRPSPDSREGRR